ncbi:MAG: hypothetical protein IKT01_01550, partial [Eubacteriaceae bacterium]|nr:hypothetical protein [Eubacteriaceae bacterium]
CNNHTSGWDRMWITERKEKRMIPSNTLEEKVAFDRFSDLMAKLMVKYGPSVLKRRKERLIEAIRSSVDINPGIQPEEVTRRLNAYHNTIDRCRRQ